MRTYLQKRLIGREGQMVGFDRNGHAVAQDLPDSAAAQLRVAIIWGEVKTPVTITANLGGQSVTETAQPGQEEVVLALREYGLWQLEAAEDSGTMTGTRREVRVDAAKEYLEVVGVDRVLKNNTPALIRETCGRGLADKVWQVGDEVSMLLGNRGGLYLQVYGFHHDTLTTGGKAGITFGCKFCLEKKRQNTAADNSTGWKNGGMRRYLEEQIFQLIPPQWQACIRPVQKLTGSGGPSSRMEASEDRLFLFSAEEVFGRVTENHNGEGSMYPIFTDDASRIKKDSQKIPVSWWLRSPAVTDTRSYCCVDMQGRPSVSTADVEQGIVFGFCV